MVKSVVEVAVEVDILLEVEVSEEDEVLLEVVVIALVVLGIGVS